MCLNWCEYILSTMFEVLIRSRASWKFSVLYRCLFDTPQDIVGFKQSIFPEYQAVHLKKATYRNLNGATQVSCTLRVIHEDQLIMKRMHTNQWSSAANTVIRFDNLVFFSSCHSISIVFVFDYLKKLIIVICVATQYSNVLDVNSYLAKSPIAIWSWINNAIS